MTDASFGPGSASDMWGKQRRCFAPWREEPNKVRARADAGGDGQRWAYVKFWNGDTTWVSTACFEIR